LADIFYIRLVFGPNIIESLKIYYANSTKMCFWDPIFKNFTTNFILKILLKFLFDSENLTETNKKIPGNKNSKIILTAIKNAEMPVFSSPFFQN